MPNSLVLMNKFFLALFIAALVYIYYSSPPTDVARAFGQAIPLIVIGLTLLANTKKRKGLGLFALIANLLICLLVTGVFIFLTNEGTLSSGILILIVFIPFFANTYFLVKKKLLVKNAHHDN